MLDFNKAWLLFDYFRSYVYSLRKIKESFCPKIKKYVVIKIMNEIKNGNN